MDHDQDPDPDESQTDPPVFLLDFILVFFVHEIVILIVVFDYLEKAYVEDDYYVEGKHQIDLKKRILKS